MQNNCPVTCPLNPFSRASVSTESSITEDSSGGSCDDADTSRNNEKVTEQKTNENNYETLVNNSSSTEISTVNNSVSILPANGISEHEGEN